VQIVLLAAGKSERMGKNKLALLYNKKPLLIHSVESAIQATSRVVLVTGYYREEVIKLLNTYNLLNHPHLIIVHNGEPQRGQFSSTLIGLRQIEESHSCAIALADTPLIQPKHYNFLQENLLDFDGVRVFYKGVPGHPMLCSSTLIKSALEVDVTSSMREFLIDKNINNVQSDDPRWVIDVDTPFAYDSLLAL
jgi:molybdenum cofactor cytidylyltransferase